MLDFKNDYVLSACIGIVAVIIYYLYNRSNKDIKTTNYNNFVYVFIAVSLLVYGGLYFKNKDTDTGTSQKGGADLSSTVSINDPEF